MRTPITNLDELKKVLFLQKTITSQAKNELLAVASDKMFNPDNLEEGAELFIEKEKVLLQKYVNYPTFSEFAASPAMYDGYKWGATFGVTLLVGELIFEQLRMSHPHFSPVIRHLFVLFLSELDHPQHEYLIEPLEKHLRYKVTSELGDEIPVEKQKAYVRDLVSQLTDTMVALCESYGIVKAKKGGIIITPLGKRVLLHLADAAKWIEDMTKAHAKFQKTRPKFSMTQ